MTPLELMILLHYYGCANDFRDGDFSAPAVRQTIDTFKGGWQLLEPAPLGPATYRLTERGRVFIDHLLSQELPVQKWVIPEPAALSSLQGKGEQ